VSALNLSTCTMDPDIKIQHDDGILTTAHISYPELKPVPWRDECLTLVVNPASRNGHHFFVQAFEPISNYQKSYTGTEADLDEHLRRAVDKLDRVVVHTTYSDDGKEVNLRSYAHTGGQVNTGAYFHWIVVENGEVVLNETNIDNFRPIYFLGVQDCPNLLRAVNKEYEDRSGQERPLRSNTVFRRASDGQDAFLLSNGKRFEFAKMHKNHEEGEPQYNWGDCIWATEDFQTLAEEPRRDHELTQAIVQFLQG